MMNKQALLKALYALLLSALLSVAADLCAAIGGRRLPTAAFLALFLLPSLLLALLKPVSLRLLRRAARVLLGLYLGGALLIAAFLAAFAKLGAYAQLDEGKAALYGGQTVLVLAPHQDDEINIAGGVIEEYLRYGSRVQLAFVTNGDYMGKGEKRLREALRAAERQGVPAEQVIFLGYGDGWFYDGEKSIYNAPADEVVTSFAGRRETYGLPEHPAFREGRSYTRRHMLEDLRALVEELRPDVIFCSDYEKHADHISSSLLLEEALGQLLKEDAGWRPLLLKSFCYNTAYFNASDYYAENMLATQDPEDIPYCAWEERLRLPVSAQTLSRSMLSSSSYWALRLHASQGASDWAERIISGDRVYWLRDTQNLCLRAEIKASSGDGALLQDFKLRDSADISTVALATDGVWIPEPGDADRELRVTLSEAAPLTRICLYDNPSPTDNVLDAEILFDDGSSLRTGPLRTLGQPTEIPLDGTRRSGFRLRLLQTEGERAGLTELEADGEKQSRLPRFIKLMDTDGNFVYDYYIDRGGEQRFLLYGPGEPALAEGAYTLDCEGEGCSAWIEDGALRVKCPKGKSCVIRLRGADGVCADTVRIANPGPFLRGSAQRVEIALRHCWDKQLPNSNAFLLVRDVYRLARYGSTASA